MDMFKKVTTITRGRHGRNVASRGVAGGPLRSSGHREVESVALEPFGTSMELGRKDPWAASARQFQDLAKRGSRGWVRRAEGLEKDEQGLGGGAKEMALQCKPKGLAS